MCSEMAGQGEAKYALEISGRQDEVGLSDNVFRFEARLVDVADDFHLSTIHGLLIYHDGIGDLCVKLHHVLDGNVHHKPVQVLQNTAATQQIAEGVDVQVSINGRNILFLHTPRIEDISQERQPGTRLIVALQKHFVGRNLDVVIDLGLDRESRKFERYFFPKLKLLDISRHPNKSGYGLKHGRWGNTFVSDVPFTFGIIYDNKS